MTAEELLKEMQEKDPQIYLIDERVSSSDDRYVFIYGEKIVTDAAYALCKEGFAVVEKLRRHDFRNTLQLTAKGKAEAV